MYVASKQARKSNLKHKYIKKGYIEPLRLLIQWEVK